MAVASSNRPNTSAGLPKMTMPLVIHPKLKAETPRDLSIHAEALEGPPGGLGTRARTMYSSAPAGLPQLTNRSTRSTSSVQLPCAPEIYGNRVPGDRGKYRNAVGFGQGLSVDELLYKLSERLRGGSHGLKHLFKNNDPSGQGQVSREALRKIFQSLVGYIDDDTHSKLLKRLGIDGQTSFSFEDIVTCLNDRDREGQASRQEWLAPAHKKELKQTQHPEEHLRYTDFSYRGNHASAPFCLSVLRDKFRNTTDFHIFRFLPSSAIELGGANKVHTFHLRGILKVLGLQITDEDFAKLWDRFDKEGVGLVPTWTFLKVLGLDETGYPRPVSTARHRLMPKFPPSAPQKRLQTLAALPPVEEKKPRAVEKQPEKPASPAADKPASAVKRHLVRSASDIGSTSNKDEEPERVASSRRPLIPKRRKPEETLHRIVDKLHYKFEENYTSMEMTLNLFDFLGNGHINRIDFRTVLDEFGMKILAVDMEQFLARCGLRAMKGQIVIRDFLTKFWNKSDSGLVHRIVSNKHHVFNSRNAVFGDTLSVDELEAKLVDFFHGDFLSLLGQLRRCDKHSIGVVTQYEFKDCVERVLGQPMTDTQWLQLKNDVGLDPDGLIPYPSFLERFNGSPNSWNKQEVANHYVRKVIKTPTPQIVNMKERQASAAKQREKELAKVQVPKTLLETIEEKVKKFEEDMEKKEECEQQEAAAGPAAGDATRLIAEHRDRPLVQIPSDVTYPPVQPYIYEGDIHYCMQSGPERVVIDDSKTDPQKAPSEDRPLFVLQYIMRELLRLRFHTVDKTYKLLDRKMTGRISKPQFSELMRLCGFPLRSGEVDAIWQMFNTGADNMCTFSNFVRTCSASDFGPPPIQDKRTVVEDRELIEKAHLKLQQKRQKDQKPAEEGLSSGKNLTAQQVKELLDKLKPQISQVSEVIRMRCRQLDQFKLGTIEAPEANTILTNCGLNLTKKECEALVNRYDENMDKRFHYTVFLNHCLGSQSQQQTSKKKTETGLSQKLSKEQKPLRKAFRRLDVDGTGQIGVTELRNILRNFGITLTEEEFFVILSEFDKNMTGKISYEQFISHVMSGKV